MVQAERFSNIEVIEIFIQLSLVSLVLLSWILELWNRTELVFQDTQKNFGVWLNGGVICHHQLIFQHGWYLSMSQWNVYAAWMTSKDPQSSKF